MERRVGDPGESAEERKGQSKRRDVSTKNDLLSSFYYIVGRVPVGLRVWRYLVRLDTFPSDFPRGVGEPPKPLLHTLTRLIRKSNVELSPSPSKDQICLSVLCFNQYTNAVRFECSISWWL